MRNTLWQAIISGVGAAITAVTAVEASGGGSWESMVIAAMGAFSTALASVAKSESAQLAAVPGAKPKPVPASQNIPGYTPEPSAAPAPPPVPPEPVLPPESGLPTRYPM